MDSDLGNARELSHLQKLRSDYQPELLPCFQGNTVRVEFGDATTVQDLTDGHTIARYFPPTYGQPLAHFLSETKKVPGAQSSTEHPAIRVGIVFCGRQSPGGHDVLWGLHEALKVHNPNSTLLGFLGGSEGLFAQETLEITDDILATYKDEGGYDLLGKTKDQIRTTEQAKASLAACSNLKLDALVIIGGVTSNTDAAQLAETFAEAKCSTKLLLYPESDQSAQLSQIETEKLIAHLVETEMSKRLSMATIDPETEFLATKRETGNEWELFKENVRPLKRGRNVRLLNDALKSHTQNQLKKSLLDKRRSLIEAIDEYKGDDPLLPWIECIKWVQEAFPQGGDYSALVMIYEQCVRSFWHSERYKNDLRYLKVWLEYAQNCEDAEVIYTFLDANEIGKTHALYYVAHALHMESKSKIKAANEIFNLGISRNSQPVEKLKDTYKQFLSRIMRKPKAFEEDLVENHASARSFGTLLASGENQRQTVENLSLGKKKLKPDKVQKTPLSIYNENVMIDFPGHQRDKPQAESNFWRTLGSRAERNKENNTIPAKWTTYKIPQKVGRATQSACIEVFVDEDCEELQKMADSNEGKTTALQLRRGDAQDIKKETELLRANPLRNFPPYSHLPR